ncbi:uncharacterized protein KNAG_0G02140 [Huiozyma naganishii CBS 8797]|uniref:AB hydrolase-1 domain-containing protein n=1 Tax=Huiozyma naganishii (strain ATCC MYA-139 / BCRC 22969 / CBS 8797 / KCTC 17520 / NBRC 10181 / NCYC 3082 / Yp74L-3) TaxID=1071383 RepID=J7S932_HUIN7|nr:hypothetical protein KNAG_0G02140 [Kazachstania naganishii CBS 8797]CCK71271.1 hypothetical protein KNAG_0G02140 [Kazachstania naganishii CBS 8797]
MAFLWGSFCSSAGGVAGVEDVVDLMSPKDRKQLSQLEAAVISGVREQLPAGVTLSQMMVADEINEWRLQNSGDADRIAVHTPTVLIHGYAASSMAFHLNVAGLSNAFSDLCVVDLPANGLSREPPMLGPKVKGQPVHWKELDKKTGSLTVVCEPPSKMSSSGVLDDPGVYEDYFVDRIEKWRLAHGFDNINVVGHSFGGYMSFKYAIKYSKHVDKLVLLSPLGVERNIDSVSNKWDVGKTYDLTDIDATSPLYYRPFTVPGYLFNNQLNVLRKMGPLGNHMAKRAIASRYSNVPGTAYHAYLHHVFYGAHTFPSANITAFTHLFTRQLLARDPLLDNIQRLKVNKLMMVYGDHDWMNKEAGYGMVQEINKERYVPAKAVYAELPSAGHNLFLDNPSGFNKLLIDFLRD